MSALTTPVALFMFNRPERVAALLDILRLVQPRRLLVVADGPRHAEERHACLACRKLIDESIDWSCSIQTEYSKTNLGCKLRLQTGLDWVFEQYEEAIIVEDDLMPEPSFFTYCEELLARYRNDNRILIISGDNFQSQRYQPVTSYYYSRYLHIWGWASWRRSWQLYRGRMEGWQTLRQTQWIHHIFPDVREAQYWHNVFDRMYHNQIDTWDYQLFYTGLVNHMLNVVPSWNHVSNYGFDANATHTHDSSSAQACMATLPVQFPLVHPEFLTPAFANDEYFGRHILLDADQSRIF